jgi:hypothetical protein
MDMICSVMRCIIPGSPDRLGTFQDDDIIVVFVFCFSDYTILIYKSMSYKMNEG